MKISFDLKAEVWKTDGWDNSSQPSKTVYAGRISRFGFTAYSDSMEGAFARAKVMLEYALDKAFEFHGEKGLQKYQDRYKIFSEKESAKVGTVGGDWTKVGEEQFHFEKEYGPA